MKKTGFKILSITFLMLVFLQMVAFADTPVLVVPETKISTSDSLLKEGDNVYFVILKDVVSKNRLFIKKGSIVEGMVTYLEPNSWAGVQAKLTIEQFVVNDVNNNRIKLIGNVYKTGNSQEGYSRFFHLWFIRGGEVHITPEKDSFYLSIKENL